MERCEIGPCQLLIDKANPPVKDNLQNTMNLKSKLTIPSFGS
jgi:hypothetical protein